LEQLLALGLSHDEVHRVVQRGWLHRLHRGVYAVGHPNIVPYGKLVAALLACGPTAFLSHRTAAAVWGLRGLSTRSIEVTVPGQTRCRPGLRVHRTATPPDPADLATRNGLRVSSVARLLIELAPVEKRSELDRLITQCVRKRILDLRAIEGALARHTRRPGVAKLKQALRAYRPHRDRHSDLERTFDKLIKGTAVPPPQTNIVLDGWELDCYWPEAGLVVELDGRDYHTAVRDMEKDKLKDSRLLLKGIRTMRVTELRLELEPHRVLADVIALTA
jgi:very-short-patch-repair endonuclease